jgi:hypothetical protein
MWLTPWWKRTDRDDILAGRHAVEEMIRKRAAGQAATAVGTTAASTAAAAGVTPDDEESVFVW